MKKKTIFCYNSYSMRWLIVQSETKSDKHYRFHSFNKVNKMINANNLAEAPNTKEDTSRGICDLLTRWCISG